MDKKEKKKKYNKEYRESHKEQIKELNKKWNKENKEERKEYMKKWREENKKQIKEQTKEYHKTDNYKKSYRIGSWKKSGVLNPDFESLYEYYLNSKNCENCDVELVEGYTASNSKCLDHDHATGLFRNVLCNTCNLKRG